MLQGSGFRAFRGLGVQSLRLVGVWPSSLGLRGNSSKSPDSQISLFKVALGSKVLGLGSWVISFCPFSF